MPRLARHVSSFLLLILASLAALPAVASPAGRDSADTTPVYTAFTPNGWQLKLYLTDWGAISQPGDSGWTRDDLDFMWKVADGANTSIYQIDGSTIGKGADNPNGKVLTDEQFSAFYDEMVADL